LSFFKAARLFSPGTRATSRWTVTGAFCAVTMPIHDYKDGILCTRHGTSGACRREEWGFGRSRSSRVEVNFIKPIAIPGADASVGHVFSGLSCLRLCGVHPDIKMPSLRRLTRRGFTAKTSESDSAKAASLAQMNCAGRSGLPGVVHDQAAARLSAENQLFHSARVVFDLVLRTRKGWGIPLHVLMAFPIGFFATPWSTRFYIFFMGSQANIRKNEVPERLFGHVRWEACFVLCWVVESLALHETRFDSRRAGQDHADCCRRRQN
jgi:hypothetical protein